MSKSKNKEARELALRFSCGSEFDYFKVTGQTMWWNQAEHNTEHLDGDHAYRNLIVRATASRTMSDHSYGWRFHYTDVGSVDLQEAERMVKWLRLIDRGLERLRRQFGCSTTFGGYVLRVAKTMGVKRFVFPSDCQDNFCREVNAEVAMAIIDGWFTDYRNGKEVKVA